MSDKPKEYYFTVNYLFAAYLQTREGGSLKIVKIEKIRPGKARFYFDISPEDAERRQMSFHNSTCAEFEAMRKSTIDLAY